MMHEGAMVNAADRGTTVTNKKDRKRGPEMHQSKKLTTGIWD